MKKTILSIFIILIFVSSSFCNIEVEGKIFFENEEMDVKFIIPDKLYASKLSTQIAIVRPGLMKLQEEIKYITSDGKKKTLKPTEAKAIEFTYDEETIRMESQGFTYKIFKERTDYYFLEKVSTGKVNLYNFYGIASGKDGWGTNAGFGKEFSHVVIQFLLIKESGDRLFFDYIGGNLKSGFKVKLTEFLSDCTSPISKIKSKVLLKEEIQAVIDAYNNNECETAPLNELNTTE